jgi:hypothetical protein
MAAIRGRPPMRRPFRSMRLQRCAAEGMRLRTRTRRPPRPIAERNAVHERMWPLLPVRRAWRMVRGGQNARHRMSRRVRNMGRRMSPHRIMNGALRRAFRKRMAGRNRMARTMFRMRHLPRSSMSNISLRRMKGVPPSRLAVAGAAVDRMVVEEVSRISRRRSRDRRSRLAVLQEAVEADPTAVAGRMVAEAAADLRQWHLEAGVVRKVTVGRTVAEVVVLRRDSAEAVDLRVVVEAGRMAVEVVTAAATVAATARGSRTNCPGTPLR